MNKKKEFQMKWPGGERLQRSNQVKERIQRMKKNVESTDTEGIQRSGQQTQVAQRVYAMGKIMI